MKASGNSFGIRMTKLLNVVLMTVPYVICLLYYYLPGMPFTLTRSGMLLMFLLFVALYSILGRTYDAFLVSISRISTMAYSQTLAATISDGFAFIVIWVLYTRFPNPLPGLLALFVQMLISLAWCILAKKFYYATRPAKKTILISDRESSFEKLIPEYGLDRKYDIRESITIDELGGDMSRLEPYEVVFLNGIHSHDRNIILKYCVDRDKTIFMIPRVGDVIMSGARPVHMLHLPVIRAGRYAPNPEYLFVKRLFDIVLSLLALVILSPIFLITAIAIKANDGGPVFYKQCRLTRDGKEFDILKFRSMRVDAESDGVARLSTGGADSRITSVGRVIRAVRIDELPQLINILKGELSICGPRPERPEIAAEYEKEIPEFHLRLQAKAGLTGYAQVHGKYNTTPYDKLLMDLMYISRPSIYEDLKIMFATVKILFQPESTEGIEEGSTTAMGNHNER